MENEIWKEVPNSNGKYTVSSLGRVRSVLKDLILSSHVSTRGYEIVTISIVSKKKVSVHRLVAMAFHPNPENKPQVNHKDLNQLNNHYLNLEWNTAQENTLHAQANGRIAIAKPYVYKGYKEGLKKIIDIDTGEIFQHSKELHKKINKPIRTIRRWLSGDRQNPTSYRYLGEEHKYKAPIKQKSPLNPVAAFDIEWNLIQKFERTVEAATYLGISNGSVTRFINGEIGAAAGKYKFKRIAPDGSYIEPKQWVSKMPPPKPKRIPLPKTPSKEIVKYDLSGNELERYSSIGEAGRKLGNEDRFRTFFKTTKTGYHKGFIYKVAK